MKPTKQWTGTKYWVDGFVNEYKIIPNKKTLYFEKQTFNELSSVVRMTITDENGTVILDESKESPLATTSQANGRSKATKSKASASKATGSHAESKRRVCRPQDV
jgi:hypothetical protein